MRGEDRRRGDREEEERKLGRRYWRYIEGRVKGKEDGRRRKRRGN